MTSTGKIVCTRIPYGDAMGLYLFLVAVQNGETDEGLASLRPHVDSLVSRMHQALYEAQVRCLL